MVKSGHAQCGIQSRPGPAGESVASVQWYWILMLCRLVAGSIVAAGRQALFEGKLYIYTTLG